MTIHVGELWDFNKPEESETRFRQALAQASPDEALILQTQIARTYGLRGDFAQARQILAEIEPQVASASAEAQVRYHLELGRSYASATHPPESQTDETRALARAAYLSAFELAKTGGLDGLAVDALHMLTFVDTAPEQQVEWNQRAIAFMQASSQPEAKKWEASLRNNLGYTLHLMGSYEDALAEFRLALALRERDGKAEPIRIAHWMIAWTLRAMGRLDEALDIQLRLEKECDEAGEPDPYVFEELELLYRALDNDERAAYYAERRKRS
jgi:tetratricopeptide (TPR) repeat protein